MLPEGQPYNIAPFNYTGSEVIGNAVLSTFGNDAITDWVMIELRDKDMPSSVVSTRAALIQRDGDVVDLDGTSPVRFIGHPADQYYIAVRHRNHLGVMTAVPMSISHFSIPIDLTDILVENFGTSPSLAENAQKERDGVRMLWAGNVLADNKVQYAGSGNDRDPILVIIGGEIPTNTVMNIYQSS